MTLNFSDISKGIEFKQFLRYGENPHQEAAWFTFPEQGLTNAKQLQGKELSYNNLIDLEAAISTVQEFTGEPAAVVIKHTNPCGVAIAPDIYSALLRALDADRVSCFGGIIALNETVNAECAKELTGAFYECIVAPKFDDEAKDILSTKKNLRLLELDIANMKVNPYNIRSILGGVVVQQKDDQPIELDKWKTVTNRQPTTDETVNLIFAWKVVRHVRSNAILIAHDGRTLGVGAGQMNRVGSADIALTAKDNKEILGPTIEGAVLASDGFFPFSDTVKLANDNGIKAVIQPGGSIKDQESIDACNELDMTMVFTGKRHFLH